MLRVFSNYQSFIHYEFTPGGRREQKKLQGDTKMVTRFKSIQTTWKTDREQFFFRMTMP